MSGADNVVVMQLGSYLEETGVTYSDFASRIGVANASVVARYVNGRVPRDKDVMAAIVRETDGRVQPADFFAPAQAEG